jgi:hypothetical protein
MAVYAGVNAFLGFGGTPTATTAEATSLYSSTLGAAYTVRQITAAAKRCMDPSVTVVVKDDVTTLTEVTQYKLDMLYGKILFQNYTPIGTITVDFTYIPILNVAGCVAFQPEITRKKLNVTTVGQTGPGGEKFLPAEFVASGTIENIEALTYDHDPGAGNVTVWGALLAGTPLLIDTQHGADSTSFDPGWRAWVLVEGIAENWTKDDLVKRPIKFTVSSYSNDNASFSFSKRYLS